ncbi:MAG: hypothetical protein JWM11_339 [Planctomycetaceae bacterium]|nr:hypothetical protein [Planctomycetaceae bacterium]
MINPEWQLIERLCVSPPFNPETSIQQGETASLSVCLGCRAAINREGSDTAVQRNDP